MLNIKILGPGCANCFVLEGLTIAAVQFLFHEAPQAFENIEVTMDHLTERVDFRKYGVLYTPGLVLNEKLVCAGRLPSAVEIKNWVAAALNTARQTAGELK